MKIYAKAYHDKDLAPENLSNAVQYTDDELSRQLAIVARMIKENLGPKVYIVTLGGFDTHANQEEEHQILLNSLSSAVKLFFDDLGATGQDQDVLAMTFGEFVRRAFENGSQQIMGLLLLSSFLILHLKITVLWERIPT